MLWQKVKRDGCRKHLLLLNADIRKEYVPAVNLEDHLVLRDRNVIISQKLSKRLQGKNKI